jgi:dTDP-4-dehydrorhamnose 3,5-epimerase-like enzyme
MADEEAPRLLRLPQRVGPGGRLTVAEGEGDVPFAIRRVFHVTDLKPGVRRGGHAHKAQEQALAALAGAIRVSLDRGGGRLEEHRLDRADALLYVPPMVWLDYAAEAPGAVLLVLASDRYDEADYIRDRAAFDAATGRR